MNEPKKIKVDRRNFLKGAAAGAVEHEVSADGDHGGGGRAPAKRVDARHELFEGERLGQVVVGAEIQALDAVADGGRRGEHEDAGLRGRARQRRAHRVPVDLGDVAIEDDHVVARHQRLLDGGGAVIGDVGGDSSIAQAVGDVVRQLEVVFDDQYAHPDIVNQARSQRHHR